MVCYGGSCERTCPMYDIHNPRMVECSSCGGTVLSWYLEDDLCPNCRGEETDVEACMQAAAFYNGSEDCLHQSLDINDFCEDNHT